MPYSSGADASSTNNVTQAPLDARFAAALKSRQARSVHRKLTVAPPGALDFSSNDFLSLSHSSQLRHAFESELARTRHLPLASGGSRLLDGNSSYAEALEARIASFHDAPAALLFNSGFDANAGVFSCVPQHGDVVLYDAHVHASVHEGIRLSRAAGAACAFAHNSLSAFDEALSAAIDANPALANAEAHLFVAVEAVYSMDGDVAPLKALLARLDRAPLPRGHAHLIVDEAHSTGVYGAQGRGLVHALGLTNRVLLRLHTFGKALAASGAAVVCSPLLRDYLVNYARSLIYTTAPGLPPLAAASAVYGMMAAGQTTALQDRLWARVGAFHDALVQSQDKLRGHVVLEPSPPASPIFSLRTYDPRALAAWCQNGACVVRPIMPPTVPDGTQRVRVCLHAGNTAEQIQRLVGLVVGWCEAQEKRAKL